MIRHSNIDGLAQDNSNSITYDLILQERYAINAWLHLVYTVLNFSDDNDNGMHIIA